MKKYLICLVPVIACTVLSVCYSAMDPDPKHPYRTQLALGYLSIAWFYIGIVYSLMFFVLLLIHDGFDVLERYLKSRSKRRLMGI